MKIGVALVDVLTGLNAAVAIVAALRRRDLDGEGVAIEVSLLDCALAGLVNVAQNALVTGEEPARYGNAHPSIVPYDLYATGEGRLVLAVGNDRQFRTFCTVAGRPELADDPDWATPAARLTSSTRCSR